MKSRSVVLDYTRITKKWTSLRRFAGYTVDIALSNVMQGHTDVAPYFSKLLYFLPFSSRSLEKVLTYSLIKASKDYMNKVGHTEVKVDELLSYEDDPEAVKAAFEDMKDLGLGEVVPPDTIRLRRDVIDGLIRNIAPFMAKDMSLDRDVDVEAGSYPYKVISGVSSLYVMLRTDRLPVSYTVMIGLTSPVAHVERGGKVQGGTTIDLRDWATARQQMSQIRVLRDKFEVEYFKALGVLYENEVIVHSYPHIEVRGTFAELVIKPAYERYYMLRRQRALTRE